MDADLPIQMAVHYLCSALEADKKTVEKLATSMARTASKDEIYMFLMALGSSVMGMSKGLSKLDENFPLFTSKLCKNLNTDDALGV